MEKKTFNIKGLINGLWSVLFVLIVALSLVFKNNYDSVICIKQGLIEQEYYKEFMWPAIYGKINNILVIITFVCGAIHIKSIMDLNSNTGKKGELLSTNIAVASQTIISLVYCAVTIISLKSLSVLSIVLIFSIVFAVFTLVYNTKAYNDMDNGNDKAKESEEWEPDLVVWTSVEKQIVIILIAVVLAVIINLPTILKGTKEAGENFRCVSEDKIELCFGHMQGIEDNRATVKVEFVNIYGEAGTEYSLEQLEQEYTSFKQGGDNWETLLRFCNESIEIELPYHMLDISTEVYPYAEKYGSLKQYFCEDDYDRDDEARRETDDKLGDGRFFAACVEQKLNRDGLTLRQLNDSSMTGVSPLHYYELEYESATTQQVKEACASVATEMGEAGGEGTLVESIDLSITYEIGDAVGDVSVTETNGYNVNAPKWYVYEEKNNGTGDYIEISNSTFLEAGKKYKLNLLVKFPMLYGAPEDVQVNVDGLTVESIKVQKATYNPPIVQNGKEAYDEVLIMIYFEASENSMPVKVLEIGFDAFRPYEGVAVSGPTDESDLCTGECVEWSVYNLKSGTVTHYWKDTFSEDILCYIASIKITADQGDSLEHVESIFVDNFYFRAALSVPEYNKEQHEYKGGTYPKAYFEKHLDGDQEYIMLYLPYYRVASTGVNGDVRTTYHMNGYDYGNYIYVVEGSGVPVENYHKMEYEFVRYEVTDSKGEVVYLEYVDYETTGKRGFITPAYPITITGYFEYMY